MSVINFSHPVHIFFKITHLTIAHEFFFCMVFLVSLFSRLVLTHLDKRFL